MNTDSIRPARKITLTLFVIQSITSAGRIAMFTVLTIVGKELSGNADWAGLPSAVVLLAAAFSAFGWGVLWDRTGRRNGLSLAIFSGAVGIGLSALAFEMGSFALLLLGLVGVGFARSGTQLSRFIASEVNLPSVRGRAISYVVFGGTVGAIVGPLMVNPSGKWAASVGLNELTGPFLVGAAFFALSVLVSQVGLRPEPMELGRKIAEEYPEENVATGSARSISVLLRHPAVIVAIAAMVFGQVVMTMLMGISALHMRELNHDLRDISFVIAAHTMGMFAFSLLSGRLADRWGRVPVIVTGTLIILSSAILAPAYTQVAPIALALFLLGLGWNFCFVGGSALLADQLSPAERARTQGFNDLLISLASAFASLGSGLVFSRLGFGTLSFFGGLIILVPLFTVMWRTINQSRSSAAVAP